MKPTYLRATYILSSNSGDDGRRVESPENAFFFVGLIGIKVIDCKIIQALFLELEVSLVNINLLEVKCVH